MTMSTRREFLQASAAATVATAAVLSGHTLPAQPGSVRVRRSVLSPTAPIADYRAGVAAMKTRPVTDPTSWLYQANMHATSATPPMGAIWNQCQHGSFFFLSWHRMYVYYFERIVRKACGNNAFALPYWNYKSPTLSIRQLPLAFRQVSIGGVPNALFNASRAPGMNSIASPTAIAYSATQDSVAFSFTNFTSPTGSGLSFGGQIVAAPGNTSIHGQIELQPHDAVHVQIGGATGDMRFPRRAARDPIFWLHHANIDRLWKRWLGQGGGRTNPTGNMVWMNTNFRFFDENGIQVTLKGADILDTVTQLQYRYDDDPAVLGPAAVLQAGAPVQKEKAVSTIATAEREGLVLGARAVRVNVPLKEDAKKAVARIEKSAQEAFDNPMVLQVEEVTFEQLSGLVYEVYLNLPNDGDDPEFLNGYFVGNLAIFADEPDPNATGQVQGHGHGHGTKLTFQFDITNLVRELAAQKKWDADRATVTFVPRGLDDENGHPVAIQTDARIKIGKVTLQSPKE